jgi:hypothetical protein
MSKWITVLTVSYPQQLWVIRTKLESEGIECFIKDELTVQSYHLYSNALGGVKLQVLEEDVERAREILTGLGYVKEEPVEVDLLTKADRKTVFIPFLKNVSVIYRIVIIILLVVTLLTTLVYFIVKPSLDDTLTSHAWCVDKIIYKNQMIGPNTLDKIISISSKGDTGCYETVDFRKTHDIILPGINKNSLTGTWKLVDVNSVVITVDTLKDIFEGVYKVDVSNTRIVLKSKTTIIYAHIDDFVFL